VRPSLYALAVTTFPAIDPDVLVVGAGPTGLLLAAELQRRGVRCLLVESHAVPNHWDRATVVHPRSIELFESLGLADQLLGAGTPQRGAKIHSDGAVIGQFDTAEAGSRYGFDVGVSEEVTERILTAYLREQGGQVTRAAKLVSVHAGEHSVHAVIDHDGVSYEVDAQWVVGCDGLHSPTRAAMGVEYQGHDITQPWAVFDAAVDGWSAAYDVTMVYLEATPVILTPLPDQRWRVYLRPTGPHSDLVADAEATLGCYYPGATFVAVENPTRFQCHSEVADRFRAGRVLIAGDAAHLCSPAQGHGMNTGLQDGANLAWKLALVLAGRADPKLLDSYEAERRPVAQVVADGGDDFERAELVHDPTERVARDDGMRASFLDPASRHHEVVAHAELDISYGDSPIVAGDADEHLGPGDRIPDTIAVQPKDDGPTLLHQHTYRAGSTVVIVAGPDAAPASVADVVAGARAAKAGSARLESVVAFAANQVADVEEAGVGGIAPAAVAELGVRDVTLFVVRPDGYVGLRADHDHLDALARFDALLRDGGR
jgi:2-polyprenyl-6-methoxyphenol hydroxylase-like FAD-dependent oxidoreductase